MSVGTMTIATIIEIELRNEVQKSSSEKSRVYWCSPANRGPPTPDQRVSDR